MESDDHRLRYRKDQHWSDNERRGLFQKETEHTECEEYLTKVCFDERNPITLREEDSEDGLEKIPDCQAIDDRESLDKPKRRSKDPRCWRHYVPDVALPQERHLEDHEAPG